MRYNRLIPFCMTVLLALFSACSDDDDMKSPLSQTQGDSENATYNSLTFKWQEVAGATQYGYELTDSDEHLVVRDVTNETTVKIGDLLPGEEYTLKVWSYAAVGSDMTTSEPIILKASTLPVAKIKTPELVCETRGKEYVVTWTSIEHAESYSYTLTSGDNVVDSGEVTTSYLSFTDLEEGSYTIAVKALTTEGGFMDSDIAQATFTVEESELWRATGVYTSAVLGTSWNATLVAYSNGMYSLLGWYGVEGYNLDFYYDPANADDMFQLADYYEFDDSSYTYKVPTGRTDQASVYVYPWYNYCTMDGNATSGSIGVFAYGASDYVTDIFTWGGTSTEAPADRFVGTWNASVSGVTYINDDWSAADFQDSQTIEITKVDDYTISMPVPYFEGETMNVKIDLANKSLTVDAMTVWDYYTLAGSSSQESPIVGHINDDGSFEFIDWYGWYEGYIYVSDTKAKYTKQ